ncbi:MAG: N-acetyltransferase family protein [Phycisphaerae bacterium]|nr:N-acetyltransferase family protein [Phycisphaerae bacterium]
MVVRDFAESDVAPANALTNHYIRHTAIHFAFAPATDAQFAEVWRAGRRCFPWLAAEIDGRFAGYCKAATWRDRDAYARTVESGIYVVPELQRRGVARRLYEALFERLRAARFRTVIAGVTLPNEASVRLHEAVGFQYVGVYRAVGCKFGAWHDVGFWQLDLIPDLPAEDPTPIANG